ncbi:hypothetical protein JMN10_05305 [Capnocytophaga genosp. AHN8471]|uniref:Uncharacterized protein n=1 Tax=Capnocytophaga genosp. AHN8471 TaxID=327574 RepID=A0ABS1YX65_9FLAO|nr:hypothetical protein [Capnocytophaga genosp. AHN8471]MBM0651012.1 hypothetical protein [Capnocytophaga genosp. AHN8471]MBM0661606.1 hypothetical protein [Capnocytophaga genosp. AHN8471]
MEIKTKFNLGDTVYYIENNKIHQGKVVRIDTTSVLNHYTYNDGSVETSQSYIETYKVLSNTYNRKQSFERHLLFATRQELLEDLMLPF